MSVPVQSSSALRSRAPSVGAGLGVVGRVGRALLAGTVLSAALTTDVIAETSPEPGAIFDPSEGVYGPPIDDSDPASSVPSQAVLDADPLAAGYLLMELSLRAEVAEAEKDYAAAARYFQAIAKAVPDRALAFSKLCHYHQLLAESDKALAACARATRLEGSKLADHLSYAALVLASAPAGQSLSPQAVVELEATLQHLDAEGVTAPELDILMCKFAVKVGDSQRLRRCVDRMVAKDPESPLTFSHRFSLALMEQDHGEASEVLDEARAANVPIEALDLMTRELESRRRAISPTLVAKAGGAVAGAAGAAWALMAVWRRRRRSAVA